MRVYRCETGPKVQLCKRSVLGLPRELTNQITSRPDITSFVNLTGLLCGFDSKCSGTESCYEHNFLFTSLIVDPENR